MPVQDTDERYKALTSQIESVFSLAKADRLPYEQRWMSNHLQYRGVYDKKVTIEKGKSRVYPRDTRVKVEGFVAKLMELMFPASESNFTFQPSPVPEIPPEDLQQITQQLTQQLQRQPTPEELNTAVYAFAEQRADNMTKECQDQLFETDWTQKCKFVVRSGGKYGLGIMRGPDVVFKEKRFYIFDPLTGAPSSESEEVPKPVFDTVSVWRAYPDFSATQWEDQQFFFEEVVMPRISVYALAKRKEFRGTLIRQWLSEHSSGNYVPGTWESTTRLAEYPESTNQRPRNRQYMLRRFVGFIRAKYLRKIPMMVDLPADDEQDVFIDAWTLDGIIVKAVTPPFGDKPSDLYHGFIYLGDEESPICGTGMPENLRDSQMQLCAMSRALMDNIACVAGPVIEVNTDVLMSGEEKKDVRSFTTFRRQGMGAEASIPAIRNITMESHIPELLSTIRYQREVLDTESMLPSWLMGQTQQLGEAFRTSNNMSMMQGGANLFAKDTIRAFDSFIKSLITSLYNWNMTFNDKEEIKGDYDVIPRGSISLLAREVRGQALDQLFMTLTPEERALVDTREALIERFKSRDLPTSLVRDENSAAQIQQQQAATAQAQMQSEQNMSAAKADNLKADTAKTIAEAQSIGAMLPVNMKTAIADSATNVIHAMGGAANSA